MLPVSQQDRHEVANRLTNSPLGSLDQATPLLVLGGFCPLCGNAVDELRDDLSFAEYRISGLCQSCQDSTFGAEGEPMETPIDPEQLNELQEPNWNELD